METEWIRIEGVKGQAAIEKAGQRIRAGELVVFPTETVYGLGANGLDADACRKIYQAKGRPSDNPLILHGASREMVSRIAEITPLGERVLAAFSPGPITMILPKKACVPKEVTGGLDTVGVRLPENPVALALIRAADVPIAAPSANLSGRPSPTTAQAAAEDLAGKVPLILDGGACPFGLESTIVDCTGGAAVILRPGAITREDLEEAGIKAAEDPSLFGADLPPRAPGMKYRHYAPRAPLTVIEAGEDMEKRLCHAAQALLRQGETLGYFVSEETAHLLQKAPFCCPKELLICYGKRGDLRQMAECLYTALRSFDDTKATALLAEGTFSSGLGAAIMNRLRKAAGK